MPRKTPQSGRRSDYRPAGFNEAAARCRGKLSARRFSRVWAQSGFNEAAARCRGKLLSANSAASPSSPSFNEAAARCRGKLGDSELIRDWTVMLQ